MHYVVTHIDDHIIVAIKPAGLLTTPVPGEDGLVDLLDRAHVGRRRLAVVHRLDKQTSGLLVFARDDASATALAKQFAGHLVERLYTAIAMGHLANEQGRIDGPVDGKRAVTHYTVKHRGSDTTTIQVKLETGRRNQIRVHFSGASHPLLGDVRIGGDAARHPHWPYERIALHAATLGFLHPKTKRQMRFEAALPPEFLPFVT